MTLSAATDRSDRPLRWPHLRGIPRDALTERALDLLGVPHLPRANERDFCCGESLWPGRDRIRRCSICGFVEGPGVVLQLFDGSTRTVSFDEFLKLAAEVRRAA